MSVTAAAAKEAELWSERAHDWAQVMESDTPWLAGLYDEVLHRLRVGPGTRVLDVGCGAGAFAARAARRGAAVCAIDITPAFVELASARVPNADIRLGDMQALPWEDAGFDLVTGFNTFFYAEDVVAALREAARVLRPGGRVAATGFGRGDRGDSAVLFAFIAEHLPAGLLDEEDAPSLESRLEAAGLTVELAEYRDNVETYADVAELTRGLLAAGPLRKLVRILGEEKLADLVGDAYTGRVLPDGSLRLTDEYRLVIARA